MQQRTLWVTTVVATVSACSFTLCRAARASGLSVATFGGEHGTPMTADPTAIFYNPGGLANSYGGHAYVDGTLAWRHLAYDHARAPSDAPNPPGGDGANDGHATLFNVLASPFIGASYRFSDFVVAAAYYTPYGGQSDWGKNDAFKNDAQYPGAVDGVQRWYSIDGELRSSYFSLGLAYALGQFGLGVSGNLIQTIVNTLRARTPGGDDDLRNEGRSWLDTSSLDLSMGLGVTYDPIPEVLRFGLSYQTRPGIAGSIRTGGHLKTVFSNGSIDDSSVDLLTNLPDVFRLGVSASVTPEVELRLFGDYTRWSALEDQCVVAKGASCDLNANGGQAGNAVILNQARDWHDTFSLRAGASYYVNMATELVGGLGYSSSAVPDGTLEPALVDLNAIQASLGASLTVFERLRLAATYTQYFYFSRNTAGESLHPTLAAPSTSPDSGGHYAQQVGALNLNANFQF